MVINNKDSKYSSPFGVSVPSAPTPARRSWSFVGIFQVNELGRRRAKKNEGGIFKRRTQALPGLIMLL